MSAPLRKFPSGKCRLVTCLLLLGFSMARSQHPTDSLGTYVITNIDVNALRGYWYTDDSLNISLEFVDTSWYQVVLDLKDGLHPYYFIKDHQDSTKVSSSGYFPNWPPFDCDLLLVNNETLELRFSQVGVTAATLRCKRRR